LAEEKEVGEVRKRRVANASYALAEEKEVGEVRSVGYHKVEKIAIGEYL